MHDSSARDPPPRCAEGTRKNVIAEILVWIKEPKPQQNILWLNGPFGNGKSAVMQTIAERLRKESPNYLAGSFFFGRGKPGRDKAEYLIPTIAYQIAINFPWMRMPIETALSLDPTILSKSIEAQLRYLITKPLQQTLDQSNPNSQSSSESFHTPTVIIDGLDECQGHDFQCRILSAISTAVFEDRTKLRFLIASRPEHQISATFRSKPLHEQHLAFKLVDDYKTREEIKQHMQSAFDRIYERHDLTYSVKKPWPSDENLETLVRRASGQFLYASTVLRFVDSDDAHPVDQLKLILTGQGIAFSNMDELYSVILESCPCQEALPVVLRSLVPLEAMNTSLTYTQADLEIISGLRTENISVVLRCIPSIIAIERPNEMLCAIDWQQFIRFYSPVVSVHHQSFIEFLTDKKRAGRFFVDKGAAYNEVVTCLDALVAECLTQSKPCIPHIFPCTWQLISRILKRDLQDSALRGWPRLRMFFDDLKHRDPLPSELSNHFLKAFSCVLSLHRSFGGFPAITDFFAVFKPVFNETHFKLFPAITDCIAASKRIFNETYFKRFLPLSTSIWRVVGLLFLARMSRSVEISEISKRTGLSGLTIVQTLEETLHLFNITAVLRRLSGEIEFCIGLNPVFRDFLHDECRSGDLYLVCRSSALRQLRYEIKQLEPKFRFTHIHNTLPFFGWNIRPDMDMEEGSPMCDVIELLHTSATQYRNFTKRAYYDWNKDNRYELLEWLGTQFCILKASLGHESSASKLRDIIDIMWNESIKGLFTMSRQPTILRISSRNNLELNRSDLNYYAKLLCFGSRMEFGFDNDVHTIIIKHWIFTLRLSLRALVVARRLTNRHPYLFFDVKWEFHLSQIPANREIRNLIRDIYHLFTTKSGDRKVTELMESVLPLSFLKASLVWYRQHYSPDTQSPSDGSEGSGHAKGFEWCEQAIARKERNLHSHVFLPQIPVSNWQ